MSTKSVVLEIYARRLLAEQCRMLDHGYVTVAHVGQALCLLLTKQGARALWEPHVKRSSAQSPHQEAVAGAIAKKTRGDELRGREIKDRVRDALNGIRASDNTLAEFAETFHFPTETQELLQRLCAVDGPEADEMLQVLSNRDAGARPYRTVQLHETHELGPDGWPHRHTTVQTIQATCDGLATVDYSYVPGENAATVEVTAGGRAVSTRPVDHPHHPGLITTTIELSHKLKAGEPHDLTYVTHFDYAHPPEQAFRRGLSPQVEVVSIKVSFDPRRLPDRVWEMEWDGDDGQEIVTQERASLAASDYSVQLIRRHSAAPWVGYSWQW